MSELYVCSRNVQCYSFFFRCGVLGTRRLCSFCAPRRAGNNMGADGAKALATMLTENHTVMSMNLSSTFHVPAVSVCFATYFVLHVHVIVIVGVLVRVCQCRCSHAVVVSCLGRVLS